MDHRRYKINREGKLLTEVQSFSSSKTQFGRSSHSQRLNPRQMREEMTAGHVFTQKRKADSLSDTLAGEMGFQPDDVLSGRLTLPTSHAGEEFLQILLDDAVEPEDESRPNVDTETSPGTRPKKRKETRNNRRDAVENRNRAFALQMDVIVDAYIRPSLAVSTRVLKLFDAMTLQCPHLLVQAFLKDLCDLHGVSYQHYLWQQFVVTHDLYIQIKNAVQSRVNAALDRTGKWRLQNACSACTYRLEGEDSLVFDMLVTMDSNDSLKRVLRRQTTYDMEGNPNHQSVEVPDSHEVSGDYYLSHERVDMWVKDRIQQGLSMHKKDGEDTPCATRWTNMVNKMTARMWSVFDKTGIFLALCHHGFALVVADMVWSGEMAKYPLAVVEALLDAFGSKLGGGYDIGCKFKATLAKSRWVNVQSLSSTQPSSTPSTATLTTASVNYQTLQHMSRALDLKILKDLLDTAQNLSEFLVKNYWQALAIISGEKDLETRMAARDIANRNIFQQWLEEEQIYLTGLTHEPAEEMLAMQYYDALNELKERREVLTALTTPRLVNYMTPGSGMSGTVPVLLHPPTNSAANGKKLRYKLRKHIAKALSSRSQAISNALKHYNTAAIAMTPKRPTLTWRQVVDYAFIADFDLLRDSRQDIRQKPWAQPANRVLMNTHFKIEQAHEEIKRLNIEIWCVITHMDHEEAFLRAKEAEVKVDDPSLACQIAKYRLIRTGFYPLHHRCFEKLATLPLFTGSLTPRVPVNKALVQHLQSSPTSAEKSSVPPLGVQVEGRPLSILKDEEDQEEEEEEEFDNMLDALIAVTY
ncbi:hypothetical protein NP233_g6025 [Leucocoprinus birnbaumii]|uniref:CxC1-like cysteine cluster associated with KDZ transposases domain-containing protein n=1 Tax=Leucocoprinus birnbaumii TaxID=56174 RepID=A0AAD5YQD8_9AGAR|nr:hypothetical protein NP233_g6025 [Leucocoprinus birnbaumii]